MRNRCTMRSNWGKSVCFLKKFRLLRTGPAGNTMDTYFDLGGYSFPVTTQSTEAQTWFDRAMIWAFGFHHVRKRRRSRRLPRAAAGLGAAPAAAPAPRLPGGRGALWSGDGAHMGLDRSDDLGPAAGARDNSSWRRRCRCVVNTPSNCLYFW